MISIHNGILENNTISRQEGHEGSSVGSNSFTASFLSGVSSSPRLGFGENA